MRKSLTLGMKKGPQSSGVVVRVVGTSPLSFDVALGMTLKLKEIGPSSHSRPSVGGKFKTTGYLIFNGITKVGRLSPAAQRAIGQPIPPTCVVTEVDPTKKILKVKFLQ